MVRVISGLVCFLVWERETSLVNEIDALILERKEGSRELIAFHSKYSLCENDIWGDIL